MPVHPFSARFEAHLGPLDIPRVPETLKVEPFWYHKKGESGPKMQFLDCALALTGVHMFFIPFCGPFGLF